MFFETSQMVMIRLKVLLMAYEHQIVISYCVFEMMLSGWRTRETRLFDNRGGEYVPF